MGRTEQELSHGRPLEGGAQRRPPRLRRHITLLAAAAITLSACSSSGAVDVEEQPTTTPEAAATTVTVPLEERGTLLSSEPLASVDPRVQNAAAASYRVVYRSTYGPDGSATDVSGTVFVPLGEPPQGGWPVVSIGHGTTGVRADCGPSGYPDLLGNTTYVTALLDAGYLVTMSDYQGLGESDGQRLHPYLEPATAAYNVIDAVRAARNTLDGQVSNRWAALGPSQGGHAVWAAAEWADEYAPDLEFVGAVSLAPAADLSPIADTQPPWQLHPLQLGLLPYVLEGMRTVRPDTNIDDYVRGTFAAGFDALADCTAEGLVDKIGIIIGTDPGDVGPVTAEATDEIRDWLQTVSLPQRQPDGPMLVIYGSEDAIIRAAWTEQAVREACEMGAVIESEERAGANHFNLGATAEAVEWINARFAGEPAPDNC
jgi:pimeloyl-ACP methyl ester carboxylesterase